MENFEKTTNDLLNQLTSYELLPRRYVFTDHGNDDKQYTIEYRNGDFSMWIEVYKNNEIGYIIEDRMKNAIVENSDPINIKQAVDAAIKFME